MCEKKNQPQLDSDCADTNAQATVDNSTLVSFECCLKVFVKPSIDRIETDRAELKWTEVKQIERQAVVLG